MENEFLFELLNPMVRIWVEKRDEDRSKDDLFVEAVTMNLLKAPKENVLQVVQVMSWENALDHLMDFAYNMTRNDLGVPETESE